MSTDGNPLLQYRGGWASLVLYGIVRGEKIKNFL